MDPIYIKFRKMLLVGKKIVLCEWQIWVCDIQEANNFIVVPQTGGFGSKNPAFTINPPSHNCSGICKYYLLCELHTIKKITLKIQ